MCITFPFHKKEMWKSGNSDLKKTEEEIRGQRSDCELQCSSVKMQVHWKRGSL